MKTDYRYLPLSSELRARSLYAIGGGYALIPAHTAYPPQAHPSDHHFHWQEGRMLQEYQLLYITRGSGVFDSQASGVRHVNAGDLLILFPGVWHRYSPEAQTGWDEYWVAFQGKYVDELMLKHALSPEDPILHPGMNELLLEYYLRIIDEAHKEAVGYQQVITAHILQILSLAAATTRRKEFEGTDILRVIEQAKCALLERIDQAVNIEEMASSLHVSYSWFRRMFRQYTGLSPAQYHLQLRINRACELLRSTTIPIAEIGHTVGIDSSYYFSRIFKETAAISAQNSRFIFTFMRPDERGRLRFEGQTRLVEWWLRLGGEPFRWGTSPELLPEFVPPWRVRQVYGSTHLKESSPISLDQSPAIGEMICLAEI
jgi:AraC-like DNA-binding protein